MNNANRSSRISSRQRVILARRSLVTLRKTDRKFAGFTEYEATITDAGLRARGSAA